jgi:hypothetical protein
MILCWLCWLPLPAAAQGPENVLVVVNLKSKDSLAIANHYVQLRGIPSQNVVYLEDAPTRITCQSDDFRQKMLLPVIEQIEQRGLAAHIDCIAWSAGFPTGVRIDDHIRALKDQAGNVDRRAWGPRASVNALTWHMHEYLADNPSYLTLDANWYARRTVRNMLEAPFLGELQSEYDAAIQNYKDDQFQTAADQFAAIVGDHPLQVAARYYLARARARADQPDEALKELELCVKSGWCYRGLLENDPAFGDLQDRPRFRKLVDSTDDIFYGMLPTRGFQRMACWSRNGWINGDMTQGKRFVLSTMLAVTSGRGNSREEAIACLKRSAAADGRQPRGSFFFSRNGDIRTKTREQQFPVALRELKRMGFGAEIIPGNLPTNRKHVLGITVGKATLNWAASRSLLEPGAICDNLTSFGGMLREADSQTPCTHFLAQGAAGVCGTVIEPLAIANKFPDARLHVHYARGCTLAEAFYQSVQAPFQLLIVGDPLCAPWARFPEFTVQGIENGKTLESDFRIRMIPAEQAAVISRFDIFLDGRRGTPLPPGRPINVDLDSLSDGYHEIRLVAVDNTAIGSRRSRSLEFVVNARGQSVNLEVAGDGTYQLQRTLSLQAESNCGEQIDIYQHSRLLGSIPGQSGSLKLNCEDLGEGPVRLQAVVVERDQRIASRPVWLEIVP